MISFLGRRLFFMFFVVIGITIIVFSLLYVLPGDPVRLMIGQSANQEAVDSLRREMGLDRPLISQYLDYLGDLFTGDLGRSYQTRRAITDELLLVVPPTIQLSLAAEAISVVIGIFLGIVAAVFSNQFIDRFITNMAAFQLSFPLFWLALMLQMLFAVNLKWLPSSGYDTGFDKYIFLPAITLAIPSSGILARMTRVAVSNVLGEDYIRTARAKGLREIMIYLRHALPNSLIPIVTMVGLDLTRLIGGIAIIEVIYSWPGLGKYAYDALVYKDLPALSGALIIFAIMVSIINLLTDIFYGVIDPRIRQA